MFGSIRLTVENTVFFFLSSDNRGSLRKYDKGTYIYYVTGDRGHPNLLQYYKGWRGSYHKLYYVLWTALKPILFFLPQVWGTKNIDELIILDQSSENECLLLTLM